MKTLTRLSAIALVACFSTWQLASLAQADGGAPAPRRIAAKAKPKVAHRTVYLYRKYGWCWTNMKRLAHFEQDVRDAGRVSRDEYRIALSLKADLSEQCHATRLPRGRVIY